MAVSELAGYLGVAASLIFFGSFGVLTKTDSLRKNEVPPIVVQMWMSVSIFASSWLVALWTPWKFTYFGILSALLWVPSNVLAITAIRLLGLGIAQGLWAGLIGIVGLASTIGGEKKHTEYKTVADEPNATIQDKQDDHRNSSESDEESQTIPIARFNGVKNTKKKRFGKHSDSIIGVLCCVGIGLAVGTQFVPMKFVPEDASGVGFSISFGIGCLIVTPLVALIDIAIEKHKISKLQVKIASIPATLSGLLWNVGNIGSVYASLSPLGLTIGFPLTQCALLVAGVWGLVYYKEIKGAAKVTRFFGSAVVLIGGAVMLSLVG